MTTLSPSPLRSRLKGLCLWSRSVAQVQSSKNTCVGSMQRLSGLNRAGTSSALFVSLLVVSLGISADLYPFSSWYKNGKTDGEPQLWCGAALSCIKTIKAPRYEDYEIEYESSKQWAFLGNGKVKAHDALPGGSIDIDGLSPCIRNVDTAWDI